MGQPLRQRRSQSFAAHLVGGPPEGFQDLDKPAVVVSRPAWLLYFLALPWSSGPSSEQFDGVFARIAPLLAKLIQKAFLALFASLLITQAQALQHLVFDAPTHLHDPFCWVSLNYESTNLIAPASALLFGVIIYESTGADMTGLLPNCYLADFASKQRTRLDQERPNEARVF